MLNGFIQVHRKLQESSFYKDSEAVHLWIHLLFKARFSEGKYWVKDEEIMLEKGQFVTGRKALSAETGINESKIQRLLKRFQRCHMIEQQTNSVSRLVSIVNYELYQEGKQQANNKRTTSEQQVNNPRTLNNKDNKESKDNKDIETQTNIWDSESFSEWDYKTAEWYNLKSIQNHPNTPSLKKTNLKEGAKAIRLLREQDGHNSEYITSVLEFALTDSWWIPNAQSITAIRKKGSNGLAKFENIASKIESAKTQSEMDFLENRNNPFSEHGTN